MPNRVVQGMGIRLITQMVLLQHNMVIKQTIDHGGTTCGLAFEPHYLNYYVNYRSFNAEDSEDLRRCALLA